MSKIKGIILFLLSVSVLACASEEASRVSQPNILWIVSEDNSPWLGSYGDALATTPRLDALAGEGIRYTRAYSNAPVCAPSRAALITGAWPIAFGTEHMRSGYKIPAEVGFYPQYLRDAGYYTSNNAKKDYNTVDRPEAWHESSRTAHYRNRAEGQPFFHIFNLGVTHESRLHQGSKAENHDPAGMELMPFHPDTPEARNDYAVYYDRLQDLDGQVGEILDQLEADGLADDTIVFYYSDHGGAVAGSKRFLREAGLHVPLVVRVPEKYRHLAEYATPGTVERPVSFVDLTATVMRLAGIEAPSHMVGSSVLHDSENPYAFAYGGRMDERRNLVRSVTDGQYRYTRNYLPHRAYGRRLEYLWNAPLMQSWAALQEAGRLNEAQASFFEARPAAELFDIRNDPHGLVNLAGRPEFADKQQELYAALTGWQAEQRDAGLVPEAMLIELDQSGVIRDYVVSADYPVAEVIELAQAAGERDAANLDRFLGQLKSGHPVKTYWAATGLLLLGDDAQAAVPAMLEAAGLVEAWTGVVLAEALYGLGHEEAAINYLRGALTHGNLMVRLQAMETVVEQNITDPAMRTSVAALIPDDPRERPYDARMARYVIKRFENEAAAGGGSEP
jgi:arylsulfatase A-like enzyme